MSFFSIFFNLIFFKEKCFYCWFINIYVNEDESMNDNLRHQVSQFLVFTEYQLKVMKPVIRWYQRRTDRWWALRSPLSLLVAAGLMHTFNAHAATDITGFGILGHAQTLARQQRSEVSFVIHNLPVLAKMAAVSKACGNMFGLMHGTCPETSGTRFHTVVLLYSRHCIL